MPVAVLVTPLDSEAIQVHPEWNVTYHARPYCRPRVELVRELDQVLALRWAIACGRCWKDGGYVA